MATERLQKILARGGIASRRAAERMITEGRVRVNGRIVTELGAKADSHKDRVEIDGQRVVSEQPVYVVLHKPRGVVATMSDPEGRPTVKELLGTVPGRVYPVGRLDFATSGVLLATNDGDFAEGLMHPKRAVPKTYVLKVSGVMQQEDIEQWRKGIRLEDGVTLPAQASILRHEGDKTWLELTIREGRNQQIRRMGEATRFPVMRLARVAFAGITSEGLRPGALRHLTREELAALKKDYGVPKRLPAPVIDDPGPGRRARRAPAHGAKGAEKGRSPAPPARRGRDASAPETSRSGSSSKSGSGRSSRGSSKSAGSEERSPRYGGGSPGRRAYDVRQDWGGGAGRGRTGSDRETSDRNAGSRDGGDTRGGGVRRGSSGGRNEQRDSREGARPREDLGGRGSPSRTTGTGGGVGASRGDDYRMRGRRR